MKNHLVLCGFILTSALYTHPALSAATTFTQLVPKPEKALFIQTQSRHMIPITIKNTSGAPIAQSLVISATLGASCEHADPVTGTNIYAPNGTVPPLTTEHFYIKSGQSIKCLIDTTHYPPEEVYIKFVAIPVPVYGANYLYEGPAAIAVTLDDQDKKMVEFNSYPTR